jgi:ubiquinone/menaquinone biosynthesis C-methylase UbiE
MTLSRLAAIAVAFLAAVFLGWRLSSRRARLPCPAWLSWLVELDNPLFRNNRAAAIVAGLELTPGMRVVDLGCGPGRLTLPMARAVAPSGAVVAFDLQPAMLAKTEARARAASLDNITFRQGALGAGALGAGPFDRATLATVLGEIPDRQEALREIFAALRPGGVLAVTEVIADPHFQTRSSVSQRAEAAGFREKRRTGGALSYTLYLVKPETGAA